MRDYSQEDPEDPPFILPANSWRPLYLALILAYLGILCCWNLLAPVIGGKYAFGGTFLCLFGAIPFVYFLNHNLPDRWLWQLYRLTTIEGALVIFFGPIIFRLLGMFLGQFFHPTE